MVKYEEDFEIEFNFQILNPDETLRNSVHQILLTSNNPHGKLYDKEEIGKTYHNNQFARVWILPPAMKDLVSGCRLRKQLNTSFH